MRIEELTPGLGVTFYVNIANEQQMTFESKIMDVNRKEHLIIAERIIKDGKVLSFGDKCGVSVDMVAAIPDEKPIWFQDISIETLKLSENEFGYNLSSAKEGIPYNRRNHFRCLIESPTHLKNSRDAFEYDVVLHDVSASGFSIVCGPNIELETGQLVHVLLEDHMEGTNRNYSFHLFGITTRRQELEDGQVIYGFRLSSHIGGLENYLLQKERTRLKESSKQQAG